MHIEHLIQNLDKKKEIEDFQYETQSGNSESEITEVESKLGITFPDQVRSFYFHYNGLETINPSLRIYPIQDLKIDNRGHIPFCIFDKQYIICFDANELNHANQWNIVSQETGYIVTMTMASFWSNKIWAWLNNKRNIWQPEKHE